MLLLVQKLPQFEYDPQQSFRAWLNDLLGDLGTSLQELPLQHEDGSGNPCPRPGWPGQNLRRHRSAL
jgi:hypothetical protein